MACTLAESPSDPLHRKLRQLRCLRRRFDCYRVERTSSRAGVAPAEVQRLSRRTFSPTTPRRIQTRRSGGFAVGVASVLCGQELVVSFRQSQRCPCSPVPYSRPCYFHSPPTT